MPTPPLARACRAAIVLGLAALAACRSERGADADDSGAAVVPPVDSRVSPALDPSRMRDSVSAPAPTGPAGLYAGTGRGQEVMITLQPSGQYMILIRGRERGRMALGRYRVAGDSLHMIPDQTSADRRPMVARLRGDTLTVDPSAKPIVLIRRRGVEVGPGVAPPPAPR